jgi:hypothetical protein
MTLSQHVLDALQITCWIHSSSSVALIVASTQSLAGIKMDARIALQVNILMLLLSHALIVQITARHASSSETVALSTVLHAQTDNLLTGRDNSVEILAIIMHSIIKLKENAKSVLVLLG